METTGTVQINNHKLAVTTIDTGSRIIVIFCHGFRSSSIGPNRFFVETARLFAGRGISSARFDQYGSGNSEGSFYDSSFKDWVATIQAFVQKYKAEGYTVCLFGQSMGGSAVLAAAAGNDAVSAVVSWVPDPNVEPFVRPDSGQIEEGGQIVSADFWQEAYDADISNSLKNVKVPVFIVQCSNDEYVSPENHQAIVHSAAKNHIVVMYEGCKHSSWSYEQAKVIIHNSVDFIVATTSSGR